VRNSCHCTQLHIIELFQSCFQFNLAQSGCVAPTTVWSRKPRVNENPDVPKSWRTKTSRFVVTVRAAAQFDWRGLFCQWHLRCPRWCCAVTNDSCQHVIGNTSKNGSLIEIVIGTHQSLQFHRGTLRRFQQTRNHRSIASHSFQLWQFENTLSLQQTIASSKWLQLRETLETRNGEAQTTMKTPKKAISVCFLFVSIAN